MDVHGDAYIDRVLAHVVQNARKNQVHEPAYNALLLSHTRKRPGLYGMAI